jgi:hypothetical protein
VVVPSPEQHDVAIIVVAGLSPRAVQEHAYPRLVALLPRLPGLCIPAPVIATQDRVALGDRIGAALEADVAVVLIGERPRLSAADSVGAYLSYDPKPGRADAERNCVSNICPPGGLSSELASSTLAPSCAPREHSTPVASASSRTARHQPSPRDDRAGRRGRPRLTSIRDPCCQRFVKQVVP